MATLETALIELKSRQTELAGNLTVMGQETATNETLKAQIPKVLRIFEDENEVLELRLKGINVRDALILTINVPTAQVGVNNEIPITFITEVGIIDWGDGTIETIAATVTPTHTYTTAGDYTVKFHHTEVGSVSIWSSGVTTAIGWGNYVTSVVQWPTNLYAIKFGGFRKLISVPGLMPVASSHPASLSSAFYWCSSIQTVPENIFNLWIDLTTIYGLFQAAAALNFIPEKLFHYNTKLISATDAFYTSAVNLISIPEDLFINQTNMTGFNGCFGITRVTHLIKGLLRNTKATDIQRFITTGIALITSELEIPLTVAQTAAMYKNCTALKTVHIRLTNVTTTYNATYGHMFQGCTSLENVIVEGTIKATISFADSPLTYESFKNISNALVDLSGQTSQSLTVSAATYALLNAADILEVTNKNWPLLIA